MLSFGTFRPRNPTLISCDAEKVLPKIGLAFDLVAD